jgi:hypothetical protein
VAAGGGSEVNVDPAALLGAGAAAVITLVASNGPWSLTELLIGAALLVLLFAFGGQSRRHPRPGRRLAWHAIAALCCALVLAFLLQQTLRWSLPRNVAASGAQSLYPGCAVVDSDKKAAFEDLDGEATACLLEVTTDLSVLVAAFGGLVLWLCTQPTPQAQIARPQTRPERRRQRDPRRRLTQLVTSRQVPGAVALLAAAGLVLYLLRVRGDPGDNLTSLLVELAGVCVEVVLIALIVDQLADARERRRWASLHAVLEGTIHRCIVDMMRLNYLFVLPHSHDEPRRGEFLDLARFSLGDLRSQVESFTASLEPEPQEMLRSIERKLNYLLRSFHSIGRQIADGTPPDIAYETYAFFTSNSNWSTLAAATSESWSLLEMLGVRSDPELVGAAHLAAKQHLGTTRLDAEFSERFYEARFRAQDALVQQRRLDLVLLDADGTDERCLFRARSRAAHRGGAAVRARGPKDVGVTWMRDSDGSQQRDRHHGRSFQDGAASSGESPWIHCSSRGHRFVSIPPTLDPAEHEESPRCPRHHDYPSLSSGSSLYVGSCGITPRQAYAGRRGAQQRALVAVPPIGTRRTPRVSAGGCTTAESAVSGQVQSRHIVIV